MWRTGLLYLDRGDSSILNALRNAGYDTQQQPGTPSRSPSRRFSMASDTESALEGKLKHEMRQQQGVQHWVMPPEVNGLKFASPRASPRTRAIDPADALGLSTDATLFEEPLLYSLDRIKEDGPPDYFAYDDLAKSPSLKGDSEEAVSVTKRRPSHLRTPSTPTIESRLASAQRASRSLPLRAKTNEGLLQLQANTSKPQRPANTHQRRISLGLPIKAANAQDQNPRHHSPTTRSLHPSTPKKLPKKTGPTSAIQQERDLEYKHRHTFIGTASLDDFLEVLDVSPENNITNKEAVIRAFILLASSERLLARQASLKPDGWSVLARTSADTVNTDYVEQAHAKLGSIVLRQFLDLITFNEEEEANAMAVVEAFTAASHLDAQASKNQASKAKAFRKRMVKDGAAQPQ
ncbi:uncharacterized protein J4E88_001029 [Alternaria novae-zelandiae]|uniref:uncharacterized protein n=1 Tax=Alternaria metachromatica TaxID=283354 RepID=UPI0020C49110|nr:uncharacterized protein J4E83_006519 [Alternaria metachromatica]XP_049196968.1 uncharacterized protein J4E93_008133 [Alternaria ventricosa]XP_049209962.1 uncharacterized protein J4E79_006418 [Alternaria viburni]XP_049217583.1 uncharacterized protein J4E78_010122 [Alternaria triticimaculans]XP_049228216.1 uncharacterized protein J4E87_010467 [Alternaria ethzedia]XP_049238810.1 uncharacterized protein J4E84_010886 [Alternaria hordeiaustralica]XP_049260530.1 uncharacterized protein J4E88_0010